MAFKKAFRKRRGARKGKGARRSRVPRSLGMSRPQTCTIRETIELAEMLPNQAYQYIFSLNQFGRAQAIGAFFKWYKAAKVEWSLEPLYNTFQEGQVTPAASVPYVYTVMNRTQSKKSMLLQDFQACGAKPIKFTSKITKSYVPNWCSPGLMCYSQNTGTGSVNQGIYTNGLKEEKGWLMGPELLAQSPNGQLASLQTSDNQLVNGLTDPLIVPVNTNQVVYNGHNVFIEQTNAPSAATVCKITCTVHWIFKEPSNYTGVSTPLPPVAVDTAGA